MISRKLSEFVFNLNYSSLPSDVIELSKKCFLDWLGCTIAGSSNETGRIFTDLVEELGGNKESTLLGNGIRTSCLNAALANGAFSHVLELDDIHKEAMYHPGVPVIPVALALAEREKTCGKDLITSIVAGYEVGIRIGVAVNPSHFQVWHTTGTVGTFGAAATAGSLLKLNEEQLISTFGNAGTQASGLWQFNLDGSMTKPLHPGKAAMNGLLAALLAKKNFTGAPNIIEGRKGFGVATSNSSENKYDFITNNLGEKYELLNIGFKIHVGCRHTNSPTDGALNLANKFKIQPQEIESIVIRTYRLAKDLTGNLNPQNMSEARFSIAYCVACAICYSSCSTGEFTPNKLNDPVLRELIGKIKIVVDKEIESSYPQGYASIVEIVTNSGGLFVERTNHAKGDPENPISYDEVKEKFNLLTKDLLSYDQIQNIIKVVENLDSVNNINEIIPLLYMNR